MFSRTIAERCKVFVTLECMSVIRKRPCLEESLRVISLDNKHILFPLDFDEEADGDFHVGCYELHCLLKFSEDENG